MEGKGSKKVNIGLVMHGIRLGVLFIVLVIAAARVIPVGAWFYVERKAAAVGKISAPVSIHLGAANTDNIIWMDMTGLDLSSGNASSPDDGTRYKDYVFSIYGEDAHRFRIQLAYTTNNQFEYELYPAVLLSSGAEAPSGNLGTVRYRTNPTDGSASVEQIYYIASGTSSIPFTKLNEKTVSGEKLGKLTSDSDSVYYPKTYDTYSYVNKYAMPVYMRSGVLEMPDMGRDFLYYFILRVIWTSGAENSKETDMIYISAEAVTG